ncbi:hypothetical protein FKM82_030009, partial [Ascaphus truei]
ELLDCEIAQEIQEKLVIESERRRRQEENDEDIARILQEKEEKRRKKHPPGPPAQEEPYYPDSAGLRKARYKEYPSEYDRPHRHGSHDGQEKGRCGPKSERSTFYVDVRERGHSADARPFPKEEEDNRGIHRHEDHHNRPTAKQKERPQRPPPPRESRQKEISSERTNGGYSDEHLSGRGRSKSHDLTINDSTDRKHQDSSNARAHRRGKEEDYDRERRSRRTSSPCHERQPRDSGHRSKGTRDSPHKPTGGMRNVEVYDAKIARRLQEEELKANKVDLRAAQVAQDEEIARLLMEKEQKAYIKSKGREKIMSDKKRADEREPDTYAHVRPRSKEGHEQHRSRSDKPYRPLPPPPDEDFDGDYGRDCTSRNQHNSPRSNSKSESSPKGSYYRR